MTVADALAVDVPRMNGSADSDLKLNGVPTPIDTDNGAFSSGPDSPAISSPPNNADAPAVKIDLDYAQRESDARHEPLPLSIEKQDDVSTHPQLGSPQDPGMFMTVLQIHSLLLTCIACRQRLFRLLPRMAHRRLPQVVS